ncbi:hypothetical protein HMPREF0973_01097 [Prevotella veroralis F0319]|uniref:Uncharacterized protein n=1 Tax=Prevotella veroralis F0319 TaxID=649761 RepID=C9MNB1_9BACT|nr:hypothetical protein HMPREF0973_01097 [Prevotella veroralis F0319]
MLVFWRTDEGVCPYFEELILITETCINRLRNKWRKRNVYVLHSFSLLILLHFSVLSIIFVRRK